MKDEQKTLETLYECQLQNVPRLEAEEEVVGLKKYLVNFKVTFAKPWNSVVKPWVKRRYKKIQPILPQQKTRVEIAATTGNEELQTGDWVRVKSAEEIDAMLDAFKEYKGCAFLSEMYQYCGTVQQVFTKVERFLDERDYKVKSSKGLVFLKNRLCTGTTAFGRCDRHCFFFWRVEWLEKIDQPKITGEQIT
jgi:hypothetical protein